MMHQLTAREWEIAQLLARGLSRKAVAVRTGISIKTVDFHIQNAAAKLPERHCTPKLRLVLFVLELPKKPDLRAILPNEAA